MTNKKYWRKRAEQNIDYAKKVENSFLSRRQKEYQRQLNNLNNSITKIYNKMLEKGTISNTELYSLDRYKKLRKQILEICTELGEDTQSEMYKSLQKVYKNSYLNTSLSENEAKNGVKISWQKLDEDRMNAVLNQTRYGADFSERIWSDCDALAKSIDKDVKSIISGGKSLADCKKAIKNEFNNSFYNVNRLVRTESMYALNSATAEKYKKLGVTQYEFLSTTDGRRCDICRALKGKTFDINKGVAGENLPPIHPHCRCTIVPVLDDE